jgi:hypothetical protein
MTGRDLKQIYKPYVIALKNAEEQVLSVAKEAYHERIEIPRVKTSLNRIFLFNVFGHFKGYYKTKFLLK